MPTVNPEEDIETKKMIVTLMHEVATLKKMLEELLKKIESKTTI